MKYEIKNDRYYINDTAVTKELFYSLYVQDFLKATDEHLSVSKAEKEQILLKDLIADTADEILDEVLPPCCEKTPEMKAFVRTKLLGLVDWEV